MNYLRRFCNQKNILIICLLGSCSLAPKLKKRIPTKTVRAIPSWFDVSDRFTFRSYSGEVPVHPFFDLAPFSSKKDVSINFFPIIPASSEVAYNFDMATGRRYKRYDYCAQKDVWKNFIWFLNTPPYTEGIVPRLIDQRGLPQKILVFGGDDYFAAEIKTRIIKSYRARIIGGVIEQFCSDYPCTAKETWLSRLVLLAVDPGDPKFGWVNTIDELKDAVNWTYVKAYMENSNGRNVTAKGDMPAYRIFGNIKPHIALSTALKKGKLFNFKSMMNLRNSCHQLYDYIWDQSVIIREKKTKLPFGRFFNRFFSKYGERYNTCIKYVRTTGLNYNIDRHWFFSYLNSFVKLNKLGYFYSCSSKIWSINPMQRMGRRKFTAKNEYKRCQTSDLNYAFDLATTTLTGLKQSFQKHIRYIEYDDAKGGTHDRIYSWVDVSGKMLGCGERPEYLIAPLDISWKRF